MPQDAVDDLVRLLDIEAIEVNIFRGGSPEEDRQRIFGGQVAGQALVAAARTVQVGRHVHSLHGYFLRAGDPKAPILYEVDRIRDGRSFTTRRVVAIQHGKAIFNMAASFQVDELGFEHAFDMPEVTPPEDLPDLRERAKTYGNKMGAWIDRPRPISLDHAMWFHRRFRADDWLLYAQDSPAATNGRGLSRGLVFTRDGTLVATVMQEGLIRVAR